MTTTRRGQMGLVPVWGGWAKKLIRGIERIRVPVLVCALVGALLGVGPAPGRAASQLSPERFREISSGVALIRTLDCSGQVIGQGTGFLVGTSVLMTARHVLRGSCGARITVAGETMRAGRWVYWASSGSRGDVEDLATVKLPRTSRGHVFTIRTTSPPIGTNLSMMGHPLGSGLSLNQGKLIARTSVEGIPVIALRMLGAEGASGSPFVDDTGRVVGVLQLGYGSKDILGQRTAGVLAGIDLARWWGARARVDLCRRYPSGGIAGCGGSSRPAAPRQREERGGDRPERSAPPASPPVPFAISDCWMSASDSWDPAAKSFSVAPAPHTMYVVVRFTRTSRASDEVSLRYRVLKPDGSTYVDDTFTSDPGYDGHRVRFELTGRDGLAPMAGDWIVEVSLNHGAPFRYAVRVERRPNPFDLSVARTTFDPYLSAFVTVSWARRQETRSTDTFQLRLVTPSGTVYSTRTILFVYLDSGSELLSLPSCFRFGSTDTCEYGTYRVEFLHNGATIESISLTGQRT